MGLGSCQQGFWTRRKEVTASVFFKTLRCCCFFTTQKPWVPAAVKNCSRNEGVQEGGGIPGLQARGRLRTNRTERKRYLIASFRGPLNGSNTVLR